MIPQIPQFMWDESMESQRRIREELEGQPDAYLEGMISAYESMKIPVALKSLASSLNVLSGNVPVDSTRLGTARRLLIERDLGKKSTPDLEEVAKYKGALREIGDGLRSLFVYNEGHARYRVAEEIVRERLQA